MRSRLLVLVTSILVLGGAVVVPHEAKAAQVLSLTLVSASGDDIVVAWSRSSDSTFVGYELYVKRSDAASYGKPAFATTNREVRASAVYGFYDSLGEPTYLEPETSYSLYVKNYDSYGTSSSNVVTASTKANMSLSLISSTATGIQISWDNPVQYGSGQGYNYSFNHYSVYKRTGPSGSYEFVHEVDDKAVMGWYDTSVEEGMEYAYYIVLWDEISFLSNGTLIDFDLHFSNAVIATVPKLIITSPNSGEQWVAGSRYSIEWDTIGYVGTVRIELLKAGVVNATVTASVVNIGSHLWTVPDDQTIASDYKIRVQATDGTAVSDESDSPISITGSLHLSSPEGGERLIAGETAVITWGSTGDGLGYLTIDLYQNGSFLLSITPGTSDDGSFEWELPSNMTLGDNFKIRIASSSYPSVSCESSSEFTIGGSVRVNEPAREDEWAVGSTQTIAWNCTGMIGPVTIELCNNSGVVQLIVSDAPNTGTFEWKIPNSVEPGIGYFIRITGTDDALANGSSDGRFVITERKTSEIAGIPIFIFAGIVAVAVAAVVVGTAVGLRRRKARAPPPPPESPPPGPPA